ncbi:crotonase/enoyl-CoA hydratase family protein [Sphingomonas solaris]|uniref:Crotonase/enoyl-CoA hydratase family protein n=1 Tax=Alterirhizorhabdus solaris TaxID=2529389 RepID=A0A558QVE6_9SPHN|nr:crotonase/enoyl-CoA hydratase family protein [Sphingomonas solaris]TVV71088.1 crotonase/enoyl-CoA hydratase family protein [Sphingomonas solaris]
MTEAGTDPILTEREGAIVTITLNAPDRRNPISDLPMIEALEAALRAAEADPAIRVAILTGAGPAFSSGGDVRKMVPGGGLRDALPARTRINYKAGIQRLPLLFHDLELPVIAAVNGPAIGAGCDLACMCDIRIAGTSARFAESFVKVGLVPGDGGAWLLPRIVGFSRATEMALTGDPIDAAEALAYGLVSRVVADADLLDTARAIAARIAVNPPHAVRMTKRLLREGQTATLPALLDLSAAMQALAHATADHEEAVAAFTARRAPVFTGR